MEQLLDKLKPLLQRLQEPATWQKAVENVRQLDGKQWQAICATVALGMFLLYMLGFFSRRIKGIPGPRGLPLFGHYLAMCRSDRHTKLLKWAAKYGKQGLFQISYMGRPCVVVVEPNLAQQVLVAQEGDLKKHPGTCKSLSEMLHGDALPSMLTSTATTDGWRAVRKCLAHSFSLPELREDFEVAKAKALLLVDVLAKLGQGVVVDMSDASTRWSLDVLGLAKFGYDFEAVETPDEVMMLRLLKECAAEWSARQAFPLRGWLWWANDSVADGRQKFQILHAFVEELWKNVKARGPPPDDDLTAAAQLLRLRSPQTGKPAPAHVALVELAGLLVAGHEAVGHALAWALRALASNQDVQEKLYRELLKAGFVNRPDMLTLDTAGPLPYLDAVVREVLRMWPTFGDGMLREVVKEVSLGRHKVPRGALVWVYPYAMQRSAYLWDSPDVFDPERWMEGKGAASGSSSSAAAATGAAAVAGSGEGYDGLDTCEETREGAAVVLGRSQKKGTKGKGGASSSKAGEEAGASGEGSGATPTLVGPQRCNTAAYMPFSQGPRACLGQAFAQAELKAGLGILVAFFKFEIADMYETRGRGGILLEPPGACGLALGPANELPLVLTLRNPEILMGTE